MNNSTNIDDSALKAEEREFEELLSDAFNAPPVPRTLLKQLDSVVEQEWGVNPRLADTQAAKVGRSLVRGSQWVRSLPLVAALTLVILCAVMFSGSSPAYAWVRVLEMLSQQDFVQLDGDGINRWMAYDDGLISESTAESSQLVDINQQVVLRHDRNGDAIQRRPVIIGSGRNQNREVLTFLMGDASGQYSEQFFATARVAEESYQEITTADGAQQGRLNVRLTADTGESVTLHLGINPDTELPVTCEIVGADHDQQVVLSYPSVTAAERMAVEFPADIPVVDVTDTDSVKTAMGSKLSVDGIRGSPETGTEAPLLPVPEPGTNDQKTVGTPGGDDSHESPFASAASEWPPVRWQKRSTAAAVVAVDDLTQTLWRENNVQPVSPAGDEEMLRRVYLDLAGRTPSVSEVRAFFGDKSPQRYTTLVNNLLDSPDYATHLAAVFRTFLIPEGVDLTAFGGVEAFDKWLSKQFESNQTYDSIVRQLLLAEGRLSHSGPLLFYSAAKLDPDHLAARTARVFLGTRLECAQCHDHPFEPWAQEDFWGFAAFFARISRPRGELATVSSVMRVRDVDRGEVMMPDSDIVVAPRFLNSSEPLKIEQPGERRQRLADWLTAAENPYFARATANRVWGMMFGRGIVNPIDDFGVENPPVAPELLDMLAGHLISSDYNLKELFRVVALSRAYQLSSGADSVNEDRLDLFAQMNVKMLTAEQVYDCITVATMLDTGTPAATMSFNVSRFDNTSRAAFLQQFRTPSGRATEYQGGIPQALTLMNGSLIDGATGLSSSGLLKSLAAPFFTNEQRIEVLYFATLSRKPKPAEWDLLRSYISEDATGQELKESLADILWALLNSAEFTMNH